MSENTDTDTTPVNQSMPDERTVLEGRARQVGVQFHPNISTEKLRERVNAKLEGLPDPGDGEGGDQESVQQVQQAQAPQFRAPAKTKQQLEIELREKMRRDHMKLVRIRIACLNPQKKDLPGEIFTVANKYLGTVRKMVPYGEGSENGYHIPHILFEDLKQRRFQQITIKKNQDGTETIFKKLVPEFAIEVLDPLTREELTQLGLKQAASHAID